MSHNSITKPLIVKSVAKKGGARNLAKGQLAFTKDKAGKDGQVIIDNFDGMTDKDVFNIIVGRADLPNGLRANHATRYETGFIPLGSVYEVKGFAPTVVKLEVDAFEVGYDGMNDNTALFIPEEKSSKVDIHLYGTAISYFTGKEYICINQRVYREKGETMQSVIRRMVKELQDTQVETQGFYASTLKLSDLIEIGIIDSTNVALTGVQWVISTLQIKDAGESNDLAVVQAQYSDKVTRIDRADGISTYAILHKVTNVLADLEIVDTTVTPKGCEDCLNGYDLIEGGIVYHVSLEDDGVDKTSVVQALPNAVPATAIKFGNKDGKGTYSVVLGDTLTDAQLTTFLTANVGAEIKKVGITNDICTKETTTTYTWTDGDPCYAQTKKFTIILKDNECGESRLEELQNFYPDLVITEATTPRPGGCKRAYETTVVTNIVCDECDDIYLQPFYAEAPVEYESNFWEAVEDAPNANAKMGYTLKGKPFYIFPENYEEDMIPYEKTSTKIRSTSFGIKEQDYLNYGELYDAKTQLAHVKQTNYSADVKNLSEMYKGAEEMSRIHFLGETKGNKNLFRRAVMGEDSLLGYGKRMLQYHIKIHDTNISQGYGGSSNIKFTIVLVVKEGEHKEVEKLVNKLAAKRGLQAVNLSPL